jgi:hypothetical protein
VKPKVRKPKKVKSDEIPDYFIEDLNEIYNN